MNQPETLRVADRFPTLAGNLRPAGVAAALRFVDSFARVVPFQWHRDPYLGSSLFHHDGRRSIDSDHQLFVAIAVRRFRSAWTATGGAVRCVHLRFGGES